MKEEKKLKEKHGRKQMRLLLDNLKEKGFFF